MDGSCLIISGGEFAQVPNRLRKAAFVIACDSGWKHAEELAIRPDLIVGDFDSSSPPAGDIPIKKFPTRKDDTDTMLAARHALDLGYRDIIVCCAFGGRLDHTLSNLQTGAYIVAHGGQVRLLGTDTDAFIFTGGCRRFPRKEGWSLSVFALSDVCEDVSISGTKYTCENVSLTNAFPLGVSNTWISDDAVISVKEGILLILSSRLKTGEHI